MATEALGTKTADVYRGFIEAVNRHDLEAAARLLDAQRYRENCVGFTHGRVDWEEAKASIRQVWKGLPDLRVELHNVLATGDVAVARGTVRGTATGAAYMARRRLSVLSKRASSTTSGSRTASSSSGAAGGRAGQMRQLYGRAMGLVGLGAMLWRLYGRYETVDVKSPPSSADSANTRSAQITPPRLRSRLPGHSKWWAHFEFSHVSLGSVSLLHGAFEIPKDPELRENRSR